jgi:hypothetical protein
MEKINPLQKLAFRETASQKSWILKTGIVLLFILSLINVVSAQGTATSGQITGSVTDPSGAAVPEATVTVTHLGTGTQRTVTTSADGNYSITNLALGTYRLSVTKSGFKETSVSNVVVNVSTVTSQNVALEVGQVTEVVQVTAESIQVETQTGAIGEVVTGQQVRELPLNGRNFVQLTQLQPGVAPQNNFDAKNKGLFAGVDFSVNGNSAQSNLFLTDGANNNDTGSNRTILLYPSIEAIAEFKMLRNSYGPEYGQAAGAVISIATRGGENQFHGSLFYFGRNDALNAREYFATRAGLERDKLRRHDFGFSLGGPIVRDRLFFFYSQEWNKEIRGSTRFGSVPTEAERKGDFRNRRNLSNGRGECSGPAIGYGWQADPHPGFATQVIPQANLSPAGLLLAQLYPLPNLPWSPNSATCDNWAQSVNSPINFREENVRIDYHFNKSHQTFFRYTQDHWSNPSPILFGAGLWGDDPFPVVESSWSQPSRQAAAKLTSTLSNTAINEIQFSYSANRINVDPGNGADLNRQINQAIPGFFPDDVKVNGLDRPHPVFWGGIAPFTSNRGSDLWTQSPFRNALDIYSIRDDFSKVQGNHSFKMGFLLDKAAKDEDSGPNNETPAFWGPFGCCLTSSGNMLADILTRGTRFGFGESNRMPVGNNRYTNLEFYFGDTWKVRPNVTLELGARYSIFFEPYDANNAISSFNPALYNPARPASDPCNGLVVPKGAGNPCADIPGASVPTEFSNRSLRENNFKNIAPRLGFAWDVFKNGKTALRAGFGQFFLRERTSPYFAALTTNPPFVRTQGGERALDTLNGIVLYGAASAGAPRFSMEPEAKTPYSLQYNITFDQELWRGSVLEVAYVGNRARNQLTQFDLNAVLPQNRIAAAFAEQNALNNLRPYSNYGSIYRFSRSGRGEYNALQLLFKTRLWNNSQFQAAYTFSRSLADFGLGESSGTTFASALLDPTNPDFNYGPSDINRPHMFVANTIINLPSLKGSNPFVRALLGGWEFATIVQLTSGTSFSPVVATNLSFFDPNANNGAGGVRSFPGGISGTGSGIGSRPFVVGNCEGSGNPENIVSPNAFSLAGFRIGELNSNEAKGACLGSPIKNVDASFYKNFTPGWLKNSFFGEASRIQFRLELFNAFNTPQFRGDSIGSTFFAGQVVCGNAPCSPSNRTITGIAPGSAIDQNFGRAGTTRGGREIQYALKFIF